MFKPSSNPLVVKFEYKKRFFNSGKFILVANAIIMVWIQLLPSFICHVLKKDFLRIFLCLTFLEPDLNFSHAIVQKVKNLIKNFNQRQYLSISKIRSSNRLMVARSVMSPTLFCKSGE